MVIEPLRTAEIDKRRSKLEEKSDVDEDYCSSVHALLGANEGCFNTAELPHEDAGDNCVGSSAPRQPDYDASKQCIISDRGLYSLVTNFTRA